MRSESKTSFPSYGRSFLITKLKRHNVVSSCNKEMNNGVFVENRANALIIIIDSNNSLGDTNKLSRIIVQNNNCSGNRVKLQWLTRLDSERISR